MSADFGKGFTITNLKYMRQFYTLYQKSHTLRGELSWSHYRLLLKVDKEKAREFYIQETIENIWSTRQLERQINSHFYERLLVSKNKKSVIDEANNAEQTQEPKAIIKSPYILDFLGLNHDKNFLESDLETAIINNLQAFILELGKGFSFVGRQQRISIDGDNYYTDLVFYNYILKCFLLIDLKKGKLSPQDVGQMDFYVRYYDQEIKPKEDNPTIGLILCTEKSKNMARYTIINDSKQLFASKYKLYLPTEKELQEELEREKYQIELEKNLNK